MTSDIRKVIAVIGATGQQGGAVVHALQASGEFKVRALTRNPNKHRAIAQEVVEADLNRPDTLKAAFQGVYGVFLVTNFWEKGTDEGKQATAAVRAARDAGVKHFIWSTLPDVEAISKGLFRVPHFTGKAKVDQIIKDAGFDYHTFVIAPFFYQNFMGALAPQKQENGSVGWALPLDPTVRGIHMGDITELGKIVAGAFAKPTDAGNGAYLPLVGELMSFNEIVDTLNQQGHAFSFTQVPSDIFTNLFEGADEIVATFSYFQAHTYLGSDASKEIALANSIAGSSMTNFADWARVNLPAQRQ
ncbi:MULTISPECIES: NmrA/HSCARG family protein [Niastella]|uniref:NmrA/HSCARG family protein n=1 Tax=Niastella soli TaxID=2821487 RepID=A0ABS3Z0K7_9BACT|nr:NmrA/HSCARG family protein [Niastella soli]MBO9203700.1 NmrA/HSCARG family protein [Niastella soli]